MQSGWLDEGENSQLHVDTVKTHHTQVQGLYIHMHIHTQNKVTALNMTVHRNAENMWLQRLHHDCRTHQHVPHVL